MFDELKGLFLWDNHGPLLKRFGFLLMAWRQSCPDVNIRSQLGWAHAWCVANPKKAPKKDIPRFLNNWMQSEQKKAGSPIRMPERSLSALERQKQFEASHVDDMSPEEMAEIRRKNMEANHG